MEHPDHEMTQTIDKALAPSATPATIRAALLYILQARPEHPVTRYNTQRLVALLEAKKSAQ